MKFTKQEKSWIAYDWANSVYATIVLAVIFPIYFTGICTSYGESGDLWWSIGTAIATAISAIVAPFLGIFADYKGLKKKLFAIFLGIGLFFTAMGVVLNSWQMLLISYMISYVGFSGSCMIYDSFLIDVTTNERMDKVSSWGYAMGYIGGSTIPFLLSIFLVTFGEGFGVDSVMAVKLSLIITVLWWAIFSIPILKNCEQKYGEDVIPNELVKTSFSKFKKTLVEIKANKGLLIFLISYFFYIDGVNTVIKMSTAYGTALGLDDTGMILALLVTQLVAFPCAIAFGKLAAKYGTINLLITSIGIYFIICITGFIMGYGIEEAFLTVGQATIIFWILAFMVGLVQGGIQALSRSHFGKMIPKEKSSEYFGFFDVLGKFAAVLGPVLYAFVKVITGRSSLAILAIIMLFFIAGILIVFGKNEIKKSEEIVKINN